MAKNIKILSVSDKIVEDLISSSSLVASDDIDLILASGDLPYYYLDQISQKFNSPLYYVRGNHDPLVEFTVKGPRSGPALGIDINKKIVEHENLLILGFEGSHWYKPGPFIYTQLQMWVYVISVLPRLLLKKIINNKNLDILITHAPSYHFHDKKGPVHQGFKAFTWLIKTFKPRYHIHGHIHFNEGDNNRKNTLSETTVINTFAFYTFEIAVERDSTYSNSKPTKARQPPASAVADFRNARRKASLQQLIAKFTNKPFELLSFDAVSSILHTDKPQYLGLKEIKLTDIVGSVGRYEDFTRDFLPKHELGQDRWTRVRDASHSPKGVPPIEVYKIGEVYFVLDGNHRVSVARQDEKSHIKANVTEIHSNVSVSPNDRPDDIIIKSQLALFLKDTDLEKLRPEIDFKVSAPGRYRQIRELITVYQSQYEIQNKEQIDFNVAVCKWVDDEYIPLTNLIRREGVMRDFPNRTLTDMYLWISKHQLKLRETLGWDVNMEQAAQDLYLEPEGGREMLLEGITAKKRARSLRSTNLDPGPEVGDWRHANSIPRSGVLMFHEILVALRGDKKSLRALDQALIIAEKEQAHIRGIHVVPEGEENNDKMIDELITEFNHRCKSRGIRGDMVIDHGPIGETLSRRARWNDLVVIDMLHPPKNEPISRLKSGVRRLIQATPRPVMVVKKVSKLKKLILAYDGSEKAKEGLYLSAYLGSQWGTEVVVITNNRDPEKDPHFRGVLEEAADYLNSLKVNPKTIMRNGKIGEELVKSAHQEAVDLIVMGGYGHKPMIEMMLGSTVDHVLRNWEYPVLICR